MLPKYKIGQQFKSKFGNWTYTIIAISPKPEMTNGKEFQYSYFTESFDHNTQSRMYNSTHEHYIINNWI